MNNDESILAELRRIAARADRQRKMTKWSLVFVAVFIPAVIVFGVVMERRLTTSIEDIAPAKKADWYDVDQNVRVGDFEKAIQIGEERILKTPQYPETHRRLASADLAAGKIKKAREHYAEAFRLFPWEEDEKLLTAADKRLKAENPQPDGPSNGNQATRPESDTNVNGGWLPSLPFALDAGASERL